MIEFREELSYLLFLLLLLSLVLVLVLLLLLSVVLLLSYLLHRPPDTLPRPETGWRSLHVPCIQVPHIPQSGCYNKPV